MTRKSEIELDVITLLCKRGQELSSTDDLDLLFERILNTATEVSKSDASSIMLLDKATNELYFRAATGNAAENVKKFRMKIDEGIAGYVARTMKPVIVNDVSKDPRHYDVIGEKISYVTRNLICVPILWENKSIGVLEVLNKEEGQNFTEKDKEYLTILANQAGASLHITSMMENLHNFYVNMLEILMMAAETLGSNQGHSVRVARLSTRIAREMGVSDDIYKDVYNASLIHDIGQIKVARENIMGGERMIPTAGAEMIRPIKMLRRIADIVETHHERWDGSGYPKGLKGEEIPLAARIIALAEEYEEWKEEEAYRKQFDPYFQDNIFKRIVKAHDPAVVEAFKEIRKKEREKVSSVIPA